MEVIVLYLKSQLMVVLKKLLKRSFDRRRRKGAICFSKLLKVKKLLTDLTLNCP